MSHPFVRRIVTDGQLDGCIIVKTVQAIIVAVYDGSTTQASEATPIVEKLGDYLKSVGY